MRPARGTTLAATLGYARLLEPALGPRPLISGLASLDRGGNGGIGAAQASSRTPRRRGSEWYWSPRAARGAAKKAARPRASKRDRGRSPAPSPSRAGGVAAFTLTSVELAHRAERQRDALGFERIDPGSLAATPSRRRRSALDARTCSGRASAARRARAPRRRAAPRAAPVPFSCAARLLEPRDRRRPARHRERARASPSPRA